MKKTIVVLLAMLLVMTLVPSMALAAGTTYRVWDSDQLAVALTSAHSGDTIYLYSGDYSLPATTIDKDITLEGGSLDDVVLKPTANTGSSGDARAWVLVNAGITLTLKNLTMDGTGFNIFQAIRSYGSVLADNLVICNMIYPSYYGHGMALMGNGNVIKNVTMHDIGRVGIGIYGTTTVENFMYTAKGYGNILDYGIEVGTTGLSQSPFSVTISNVTITGNRGIVNDQWGSSGILISTYFYALEGGTTTPLVTVTIDHANISNCSCGIDAGYTDGYLECSSTTVTNSNFFGNEYDLIFVGKSPGSGTFSTTGNYYGGSAPVYWTDPGLTITGLESYVTTPVPMDQDTDVTAGVDPSYIIVIPAAVDFGTLVKDSGVVTQEFDVSAQSVVIESGASIDVEVTGPFVMKDEDGAGTVPLAYTLSNEAGAISSPYPATFATFTATTPADGTEDGSVSVDTAAITAAGSYEGTMVFTITYND